MTDDKRGHGPLAPPYEWVMGTPVTPQTQQSRFPPINDQHAVPINLSTNYGRSDSYAAYPYPGTSMPCSSGPPFHTGGGSGSGGNPYVNVSPITTGSASGKSSVDTIFKVLGRCGKKLEVGTRQATDVAGNVWQHLKTSPNMTDAAIARLTQGTKVFAEGGNDKVFQQTFGVFPGEQLLKTYACYISTSSGPIIGTLYLSTARIAFCSDNPLHQNASQGQQDMIYYKVVVPREQLKTVNPSANSRNPGERYIQIVTMDNNEFWFMGFVSYEKALRNLTEASQQFAAYGLYGHN